MNNRLHRPCIRVGLCLLGGAALTLLLLGAASLAVETSDREGEPAVASVYYPPADYGTFYLYVANSADLWNEAHRAEMRAVLQQVQALSLTTVVQGFPNVLTSLGRESDWLIFLDEAEAAGIKIVAHLVLGGSNEDACSYNTSSGQFNCTALKHFLSHVHDHPALAGYVILHEGLQRFDSDQFRAVYNEMKGLYPDLAIANYMGDIYWFEQHPDLYPNRTFGEGICDICMLWYYPFRYLDGEAVFETAQVENLIDNNLPLIQAGDPDARFWFLGQAFEYEDHPRNLRMPTRDEMIELYQLVMQRPIDGFLWYAWQHGTYDLNLGDIGAQTQREELPIIAEQFLREADLIVTQAFVDNLPEAWSGDVLTWTLHFTNTGPEPAWGVSIENAIGVPLVEPQVLGSSGVAVTRSVGITFAWDVGVLQVGQGGVLTLTARVDPELPERVQIVQPAVISGTTTDQNVVNNESNIRLEVGHYRLYLPLTLSNQDVQ